MLAFIFYVYACLYIYIYLYVSIIVWSIVNLLSKVNHYTAATYN